MSPVAGDAIYERMIDRVVREVIYRLEKTDCPEPETAGTAVLLTAYVPGHKEAIAAIETCFNGTAEYIGFEGNSFPEGLRAKVINAEETGYESILNKIAEKENVILLAPSLVLLENIAAGNDDTIVAYIMTRSLLWGKNVTVMLDFEPPRFKRNTFFEKVAGTIDTLTDIGIGVTTYKPMPDQNAGMLELVTERDIREADKSGRASVRKAPGALVTPSARDAARELNISID